MTASITTIRRANLLGLYKEFMNDRERAGLPEFKAQKDFADRLEVHPAMWSQIKNSRPIGDKLARQIEHRCGRPMGWLDKERVQTGPTQAEARFLEKALEKYRRVNADGRRMLRRQMEEEATMTMTTDDEQSSEPASQESGRPAIKRIRKDLYGHSDVRPAASNRIAAKFFRTLAKEREDGALYSCQASLLFSAFTFEAFLNSVGPKVVGKDWDERRSPAEKLDAIFQKLGHQPPKGRRPYQTIEALFAFRNALAHGKDERVEVNGDRVSSKAPTIDIVKGVMTHWERYATDENAARAFKDVQDIAVEVCTLAKLPLWGGSPFGPPASGMFRIHETEEEIPRGRSKK